MVWFWDIVLNEWDDAKRRSLLQFSTGSDRAPVNGLKAMKFYIIKDGEDAARLPTSHTCFNQLDLPEYSNEHMMKRKLVQAVEEAHEGFGFI